MGYWAKDGSYVYDEKDIEVGESQRRRQDPITFNPTGEVTTGSIYDADEKTIEGIERMIQGQRQTKVTFNPTGEVTTGSIYDADEKTIEGIERMVQGQKEKDKPNKQVINDILKELPSNKEDLSAELSRVNYRLDLMKKLVEGYRDQFVDIARKYKSDYSPEASEIINNKLTEYLCLIETLKTDGYNFGSTVNSYSDSPTKGGYDPQRPEMVLDEVMGIMHIRRKNGADVSIPFPVNYDLENNEQLKGDAVTIIYNVDQHLRNNQYMNLNWKKAGYEPPETSKSL